MYVQCTRPKSYNINTAKGLSFILSKQFTSTMEKKYKYYVLSITLRKVMIYHIFQSVECPTV